MKQAYLIIAHNKIEQLKFLLSLLDYEKHDIFILFDKKVEITDKQKNELTQIVTKSNIFFTREIPIYWGDYSLVEAEIELFETANKQENYSMYHLLSGVDLPLDTAEKIYNFFDSRKEYNFLTMVSDELYIRNKVYERVAFKTILPHLTVRTVNNNFLRSVLKIYRRFEVELQRIFKVDCFKKFNLELKYASNWCSLNKEAVDILLEEKQLIATIFKNTKVNDELFIPTVLQKHQLLDTVYSIEPTNDRPTDFQGNLRYINWWDGSPYTWTDSSDDIEQLKRGKALGHKFSRKFDLERNPNLKEKILTIINRTD
ncbi:exopolysaccharide gene claster protein [Streptococcus pneumoniae]|uniref:beta-1,6-N-acetylglucosaminyltransferase n=1 Tax=Streptococcus pneumoniae TaxID=1313 RepID=UPI0005E8CB7D|nr:beta-1,6-N-acetylglucosaminyltransferase [Streptococcus pneumoniae]CJJ27940.1 exopolysaccharide gene claster protein [Streptococcus pneumoniae]CJM52187.1 exopolysaccharide gene claster protein [Streptococcus pneumoniae]CJQ27978.1 exopolysaccharide gene claster protein [Streptococcus pneumoniae]COF29167.1 exopolysaccharide gene claster protein [Streptococcus pneumoniae]COM04903.1 exopolysaccharide gene claster protein [Streptococcus pneumoniae]